MEQIILEPPLYFAENHIWSVCFHPHNNIIACTEITGAVEILAYNSEDVHSLLQIKDLHKMSVRHCTFNSTGNLLATCGKDRRLGFVDSNGKIAHIIKKAHDNPINRVKFMDDQTLISGDDEGTIKIWDLRTTSAVFWASQQTDSITGIAYQINTNYLLSSSNNGTIGVYDLKQGAQSSKKLVAISDSIDQELLGIQIMKNNRYVVCPTSQGSLVIYKWNQFNQCIDKIQGHPNSVDAMIKINQNTLITGSEDGYIRGVSLYPNKILQTLGQHEQQQHFPIQSLSLSHCKNIAATSSHDNSIKFYDVSTFIQKRNQVIDQIQDQKYENIQNQKDNSEYSDMDDEDDNSQSDSAPKKTNKKTNIKLRKSQIKRQQKMAFFKNLEEQQ